MRRELDPSWPIKHWNMASLFDPWESPRRNPNKFGVQLYQKGELITLNWVMEVQFCDILAMETIYKLILAHVMKMRLRFWLIWLCMHHCLKLIDELKIFDGILRGAGEDCHLWKGCRKFKACLSDKINSDISHQSWFRDILKKSRFRSLS